MCTAVKPNLVWPAMNEVEATETAKGLVQQLARMLRKQLKKLEAPVNSSEYDSAVTAELVKIGNTMNKLTEQVRKLEDRENDRLAALSFDEQVRLIATEFFAQIPEQHQRAMLQLLESELHRSSTPYMLADVVEVSGA